MVDHQVDCLVEKEVEGGRRRRRGLSSVQLVIWNEKKTRVNGTVKGLKAQSSFSSAPASQNKTRAGLRFTSVLPSRRVSFSPFPAVDTLIVNPSLTPRYRPWTVQNSLAMINSVASERWLQCDSWLIMVNEPMIPWNFESLWILRIEGEILFIYHHFEIVVRKTMVLHKEEVNVELNEVLNFVI